MSKVKFNKKTHKYTLVDSKGKKITDLVSVTQLLKKHGISPDYSQVDEDTLKAKAKRGTIIHEELERYINNGEEIGFTNELSLFIDKCKKMGLRPLISEFIVNNDEIAGTVDVCGEYLDTNITFIGDFKTTSTLHKKSVAWQLSLYAYLSGKTYDKFIAFHFPDENTLKIVDDIKPIPIDEIEELLRCERDCEIYHEKSFELTTIDTQKIIAVQTALKNIAEQKKELESQEKALNEFLINKFEETGTELIENDFFRIKYTAPTTRETIDTGKFQEEFPDLAERFKRISSVKAKITITLRGK